MMKELGAMMNLLGNQDKLREQMAQFQASVAAITAEAASGGGMVTVKVNGRLEVLSIKIGDDALKLNDREMLEDLISSAVNMALNKARELLSAETAKMAGGMGLPPGMLGGMGGIPGMG